MTQPPQTFVLVKARHYFVLKRLHFWMLYCVLKWDVMYWYCTEATQPNKHQMTLLCSKEGHSSLKPRWEENNDRIIISVKFFSDKLASAPLVLIDICNFRTEKWLHYKIRVDSYGKPLNSEKWLHSWNWFVTLRNDSTKRNNSIQSDWLRKVVDLWKQLNSKKQLN